MRTTSALAGTLATGLAGALLVAAPPTGAVPAGAAARAVTGLPSYDARAARPAVLEKRVIGRSVLGRPITAWRLGEPAAPGARTVVLISTMHGNEPDTRRILETLRDGAPVHDLDLWVLPTYNPDGLARGTRRNARGVDLNRNFPHDWRDLDGSYESGPGPASEPETRAVMGFLRAVRPDRVLSFHQPLLGVDTQTKRPEFARRVARTLRLPTRTLDCGGTCHGTMTGWFNRRFAGAALTVEYGASPTRHRMTKVAPDQVLRIFGAHRGPRSLEPAP